MTIRQSKLFLNAATWEKGAIRAEANWKPIPGSTEPQAFGIRGDALDHPLRWKDKADLSQLLGKATRLKFNMTRARIYAVSLSHEARNLGAVEDEYRHDELADSAPKLI